MTFAATYRGSQEVGPVHDSESFLASLNQMVIPYTVVTQVIDLHSVIGVRYR